MIIYASCKIDLNDKLRAKLREIRINNLVSQEVLTAENLSKAIGNNRAWMSQIESGRLKKIKREDVIAIYKLLFSVSSDSEAEEMAEVDLFGFIVTNPTALSIERGVEKNAMTIGQRELYLYARDTILAGEKITGSLNFYIHLVSSAAAKYEADYCSKGNHIFTKKDVETVAATLFLEMR